MKNWMRLALASLAGVFGDLYAVLNEGFVDGRMRRYGKELRSSAEVLDAKRPTQTEDFRST